MRQDKNIEAFFALVKSGLWSNDNVDLNLEFVGVDWSRVYQFAEEQSVVGLVAAGIDNLKVDHNIKIPQEWALQFVGSALQLEQQNKAMNAFIAGLIAKMRATGIYTLLVKGQGVAQSYEKPLWRACGDVDLLLSDDNYQKAKDFLLPKATSVEAEDTKKCHFGMTIDGWVVELHGSLRCGFSSRVDTALDEIYHDTFYNGNVTSWNNNGVQVFMLDRENDVLYVFAHFLNHFYKGGLGLRQICDWCRLLWTYRESLDLKKLGSLLKEAGLMSEWKAFGALANDYLGLDVDVIPFYSNGSRWKRKASRIEKFIMKVGNFGHNRDMSYFRTKSYLVRKTMSLGRRLGDLLNHFCLFPLDTLRFTPRILINGLRSAANGE